MDLDKIINSYQSVVKDKDCSNPSKVAEEKEATLGKVQNVSALANLLGDIGTVYDLIRDTVSGRYRGISKSTLALLAGGLAYLALPVDLVPDFIPVAGWLDDAAVLTWIFSQSAAEICKYKEYKSSVKNDK